MTAPAGPAIADPVETGPVTSVDASADPRADVGRALARTAAELKKVGLGDPDARAFRRLRRRADAGGAA